MEMLDLELGEDFDFGKMLDESLGNSENNAIVEGVVVGKTSEYLLIDVGQKIEGRLNIEETLVNGVSAFNVGDKIEVMLLGGNRERPSISYKNVIQQKKFNDFAASNGEDFENLVVEGKVVSLRKGKWFIVEDSNGLSFLMPLSQSYLKTQDAIGKKVKAKVTKINKNQNSIFISRKKYIDDIKKDKNEKISTIMSTEGMLTGQVKKITSYGMFVEVDGIDGLVNYNEISYKGPVNPALYFKEGDKVSVKVLSYDKDKNHLSLSVKAALSNPWEEIRNVLDKGDTITVTVSNFESYGAFVDLGNDIEGLLHISEISWDKNVKNPRDYLTIGDEINVEVIELDIDNQKLRVSLKNLQKKPFDRFNENHKVGDVVDGIVATVTDFGAFITIDGVDGLLHNEEADWTKNAKCKNMFKKGDEVKVKITQINTDNETISLSIKELLDSPAKEFQNQFKIGDIVKGKIKDIKDFGVFVILSDNLDGLIRIEDLSPLKAEELQKGQEIESCISFVDSKNNKVRLSVKRLERKKEQVVMSKINSNDHMTLGDLIKGQI
jgi:small subunit ribosomal protein S1